MLEDEICHVGHAVAAQFYVVAVADLVKSMGGWKVLCSESAEFSIKVCANVFTIWWVKQYNFSFSRFSFVWVGTRFIFCFALVSAAAHGFFILWDGFCEFFVVS